MTTPDATPDPLPEIPDVTLHAEIARGGMGVVYRGRQDFLDRDVAVKVLAAHLRGESFAARFRREAKILAGIKHPNIVACHAAGTTSAGSSYLVMEFVDGPNLKSWIAEHGALEVPAALRLARQLASALSHAAEQGVVHRDVKPENVLLEAPTSTSIDLTFPFVPKLVDLGLARMVHETGDRALTLPGAVMGTPATMAPEQFDDPDGVDHRADIYGLGCVLYQMLTGVLPFASAQLTDLVVAKRSSDAHDPCARRTDLPAAVGRLVAAMLASDREARPATYRELIAVLDEQIAAASGATPAARRTGAGGSRGGAGPNLLQTAELAFLAEGGGVGAAAGGTAVAFPDPTGVLPRPSPSPSPPPSPPSPSARAPAPRASGPAPVARPPARRGRRWVVVCALASIAFVALTVGVIRARRHRPARPEAVPAVAQSPRGELAIRGLDGAVRPDLPIELTAVLPAGEVGALRCRWTVTPVGAGHLARPEARSTSLVLDGLPGDAVTIALEVGDGLAAPARVTRQLVLDYAPADLFADFLADDGAWSAPGRLRGVGWTRRGGDGAVVAAAPLVPATRTRPIPGSTWRVAGQLCPERDGRRAFAELAVVVRLASARPLAVLCERSGPDGEQWSISLQLVDRDDRRGAITYLPLPERPAPLQVLDRRGRLPGASYTITRRGEQLAFELGFPGSSDIVEHTERLRSDAGDATLILYAKGGRGVFPKLELW
ncbi:MAG: serine/threonine protein kinase [Planctomycetes bacterium]|nr:serine/threonine protein kinase [Planctomycetota bacterium]